jgi:hypothetical protein
MNPTVKTLLVWLLMIVLPLHAAAASVGMSCAPTGRQPVQAMAGAAMAHGPGADAAHAHHGGGHGSAHGSVQGAPAHAEESSAREPGKKAHSSCSACSALCIGAVAPPSAFLSLPTFDGSDAVAVAPTPLIAGFIPDGLQRPPRHPSA